MLTIHGTLPANEVLDFKYSDLSVSSEGKSIKACLLHDIYIVVRSIFTFNIKKDVV